MKDKIKIVFKIYLSLAFLWFSSVTLLDFYNGKVSYDILKEKNVSLHFPALTLCPSQDGAIVPLNFKTLKETLPERNFSHQDQTVYRMLQNISNPIEIVKNFSFSNIDAQISGCFA